MTKTDHNPESQTRAGTMQYSSIIGGQFFEFEVDPDGNITREDDGLGELSKMYMDLSREEHEDDPGLLDYMPDEEYDRDVEINDVWEMMDKGEV
jgi:hypothetical protein